MQMDIVEALSALQSAIARAEVQGSAGLPNTISALYKDAVEIGRRIQADDRTAAIESEQINKLTDGLFDALVQATARRTPNYAVSPHRLFCFDRFGRSALRRPKLTPLRPMRRWGSLTGRRAREGLQPGLSNGRVMPTPSRS